VVCREEHHTKNYQSRRILMNQALAEALRRHPHRLENPYVFCNRQGESYDNVDRRYGALGNGQGLSKVSNSTNYGMPSVRTR
jgi:hypothetical protein